MNRILTQKEWEQSVAETFSAAVESTYKSMIDEAVRREREACANIDWVSILREGGLVTWGDAKTLADRVYTIIRARGGK